MSAALAVDRTTVLQRRVRLLVGGVLVYNVLEAATAISAGPLASSTAGREVEHSSLGIALAAVSLLVMPIASFVERRTGEELGSASVVADSKQLLLCSYLSAVLLGGLLMNSTFGWSWADPVAGLLIAGLAVREGRNALRGEVCCAPPVTLLAEVDGCDDGGGS